MGWAAYRALEPSQPLAITSAIVLLRPSQSCATLREPAFSLSVAETRHDHRPFDPHLHNRPRCHHADRHSQWPRCSFWDARRAQFAALDGTISGYDHSDERHGIYVSNPRIYAGARDRRCLDCCFSGSGVCAVPETFGRSLALDLCGGRRPGPLLQCVGLDRAIVPKNIAVACACADPVRAAVPDGPGWDTGCFCSG